MTISSALRREVSALCLAGIHKQLAAAGAPGAERRNHAWPQACWPSLREQRKPLHVLSRLCAHIYGNNHTACNSITRTAHARF